MRRRDVLRLAAVTPLAGAEPRLARAAALPRGLDLEAIQRAPGRVVLAGGAPAPDTLKLVREWDGPFCRSLLSNAGDSAVRVERVVLFDLTDGLPPETRLYGEGFQMLSQTGGTRGEPRALGDYTDARHYKLPEPEGAAVLYGLATLSPADDVHHLMAFTSCRRFSGQFTVRGTTLEAALETEGLELRPGESWELEEVTFRTGRERASLLADLAGRLARNHPPCVSPRRRRAGAPGIASGPGSPASRRIACLLNWDDAPQSLSFPLPGPHRVVDLWSDEDRGRHDRAVTTTLPARSGRVLVCDSQR